MRFGASDNTKTSQMIDRGFFKNHHEPAYMSYKKGAGRGNRTVPDVIVDATRDNVSIHFVKTNLLEKFNKCYTMQLNYLF